MKFVILISLVIIKFCLNGNIITDNVVDLTNDTFNQYLDSHNNVIVKFYSPNDKYDKYCKLFSKEFSEFFLFLKNKKFYFAQVNISSQKLLATRFNISKFCTLIFFKNKIPIEYSGAITQSKIIKWIRTKSLNTLRKLKKVENYSNKTKISPKFFIDTLSAKNINFFTGVPDNLLEDICSYIADNKDSFHNIIATNEGGALALAAGHYLATGEIGVVYMQNSGEGNIINPLISLVDKEVYNIPILIIIAWRGKPSINDGPEHAKQGKLTIPLLKILGMNYTIMSTNEKELLEQINDAVKYMKSTKEPYVFITEKDTFDKYESKSMKLNLSNLKLSREYAIQKVASFIGEKDVIVASTGMISWELFEYRSSNFQKHEKDFLNVGAMGHASQIALGIAMEKQDRNVWCFDGDGALLMHMGSIAIIGTKHPKNYIHVLFNNGAHGSVGGQPTIGFDIDIPTIAKAVGYSVVLSVKSEEELNSALKKIKNAEGPIFLEIKVKIGNRKNLRNPKTSPVENKEAFMKFLNK